MKNIIETENGKIANNTHRWFYEKMFYPYIYIYLINYLSLFLYSSIIFLLAIWLETTTYLVFAIVSYS